MMFSLNDFLILFDIRIAKQFWELNDMNFFFKYSFYHRTLAKLKTRYHFPYNHIVTHILLKNIYLNFNHSIFPYAYFWVINFTKMHLPEIYLIR